MYLCVIVYVFMCELVFVNLCHLCDTRPPPLITAEKAKLLQLLSIAIIYLYLLIYKFQ